MKSMQSRLGWARGIWVAVFFLLAAGIVAIGCLYYQQYKRQFRAAEEHQLSVVADLKVEQIAQWRHERLADAAYLRHTPYIARRALDVLKEPGVASTAQMLIASLQPFIADSLFEHVHLLDDRLNVRLTHPARAPFALGDTAQRAAKEALRSREIMVADLHRDTENGPVYITVMVPVVARREGTKDKVPAAGMESSVADRSMGVLVLEINAQKSLYPFLETWPTPSRSAESLLVRREGDEVVFLSPLRHRKDAPLNLRAASTNSLLPAADGGSKEAGVFAANDYRGVPVLSAAKAVSGTQWVLVAKVDEDEVFAELHARAGFIGLMVGALILMVGATTAYFYRQRQSVLFRELYESERRQREAQEAYRTTLYSIGDAVITTDTEGRVREMNLMAEKLTGWTEAEARSQPLAHVLRLISEVTRQPTEDPVSHVLRDGKVVELANQTLLIARDGREYNIADTAAPIRNEAGVVSGVVMVFSDQTERHAARNALRESEERYLRQRNALIAFTGSGAPNSNDLANTFRRLTETDAKTLQVARVSLWRYNHDRTAIRCLDLYELETDRHSSGVELSVADYPAYFQALAGMDVIAADDAHRDPRTCEFSENYLGPLGIASMLDATIHLNGAVDGILCHEHVGPLREWTADEKTFVVAVANLASLALEGWERQRAEGQLRLQSSALKAAANAIVITDREGVIEWVNPAFTTFTGYTAAEAIGGKPGELLKSGKHDQSFYRAMWDTILTGAVWRGETINRRKDGSIYTEDMTITPLKEDGQITHFIAVKQDITNRMALEDQLRQSQKMQAIGQLAGGVAHDFNNMLGVIQGHASLLQMGLSPNDQKTCLFEISRAADRAANLTRQLLAFSRRQIMQARALDLNDVISGMVKMLHRIIGEDIILQTRLLSGGAPMHGDPGMIEQVLLNLAVNARDAMPKGGQISVELASVNLDEAAATVHPEGRPGDFIRLSVKDTGTGIAPEHLPRIFEPFFTTKDVGKGTGLGLATVHGIVAQHQGWIEVESQVGQGALFYIYLPRIAVPEPTASTVPLASQVPGGSETILLVEDDSSLRELAGRSLKRFGYSVIEAPNGVAALEVWQQHRESVALLLTDIIMPEGLSGCDLSEQLRADKPLLKVIHMSGYPGERAGRGLDLRDGVNFLAKPFSTFKLAQTVRNCLDTALKDEG